MSETLNAERIIELAKMAPRPFPIQPACADDGPRYFLITTRSKALNNLSAGWTFVAVIRNGRFVGVEPAPIDGTPDGLCAYVLDDYL